MSSDFRPPAFHRYGLPVMVLLCRLMFLLFGPFFAYGKRQLPRKGGLLILSNHLSDCDPVAVQIACPRPIFFMAKSELFEMPVLGKVLKMNHAFPVKRGEPDRNALKQAADYLKQGAVVCVFPEGQLSETGKLQELKPGIALIVRMAQVPVVCLGLQGTQRIIPYGSVIPRPAFHRIVARWGQPRSFDRTASVEEIMDWAEAELRALTSA